MNIGDQITSVRREQQLTQEQFGGMFHVTRQTVSNWENGKSYPDLQTLIAISDRFGVSLDCFTGAGTGLVASCVLAPASSVRTAVFIVGFLMICIGWWKRAQCDRKVLAYMESQEKV